MGTRNRISRWWSGDEVAAFGLLTLGLLGCAGEIGGSSGAPGPPEVVPDTVPADLEVITSTSACFALEEGEHLASVSPEGHAWLLSEAGETTNIRVIDPLAPDAPVVVALPLAGIEQIEAWSEDDAALIADGLWRLESFARITIVPPEGFAPPATFCGDASRNGFLAAGGRIYEHRADDQWWQWQPNVVATAAPSQLLTYEGECVGLDNFLWATAADGTLWRIDGAEAAAPVRFSALKSAAVTGRNVAVLDGEQLWIGPAPWSAWVFPGPAPTALSAAEGMLWMMSGDQLLRFDGESWSEVSHELPEPPLAFEAHAAGIWLAGATQICHQAVGAIVRIAGLRPYERTGKPGFELLIQENGMSVTATLDSEALSLGPSADEGWLVASGEFASVGWHAFEIVAEGSMLAGDRVVEVKRLPEVVRSWATDIEPIYQATCSASSCHGSQEAPNAPDLSSYGAWKDHAQDIRTRVVEDKTMPPPGSEGPNWSDEQVEIIAQWLEGGMLP